MNETEKNMYAAFLDLKGLECLLVGGGKVAGRKAGLLLEACAAVTVVAPEAGNRISGLAKSGRLKWEKREYLDGEAADYFLIVAATNNRDLNSRVSRDALNAKRLINAVDMPELCNFYVPSLLKRGELRIALSTSGACPALARKLRKDLEDRYPESYARLVAALRSYRERIIAEVPDGAERKQLIERAVYSPEAERFLEGDEGPLKDMLEL
ncbi:bifunctional precorrin-2 dehydrogenase/sirohydrochlorin ferrochelatase [bacterium]